MPTCKIVQDYYTVEGWRVGDVVEITNPTQLLKEGKVVLLNDKGEEVPPPGVVLQCPICPVIEKDAVSLAHHILAHAEKKEKIVLSDRKADIRKRRLEALEKARAARKLKMLEKDVKKKEEERDTALKEAIEATQVS